jgi:hypothetical protein
VQINVDLPVPAESVRNASAVTMPSDSVVVEAMRMNTEIARSVIERFPQILAAPTLLRAADGAGLPAREPRIDDGDEETIEAAPVRTGSAGLEMLAALRRPSSPPFVRTKLAHPKKLDRSWTLSWMRAFFRSFSSTETRSNGARMPFLGCALSFFARYTPVVRRRFGQIESNDEESDWARAWQLELDRRAATSNTAAVTPSEWTEVRARVLARLSGEKRR